MKLRWKIDKLKPPRFSRQSALTVGAGLLGLVLLRAGSSWPGPAPAPGPGIPPIGGQPGTPKWSVGDVLKSTKLPSATWTILSIRYETKEYFARLDFAGSSTIKVFWTQLETSDFYKTGETYV